MPSSNQSKRRPLINMKHSLPDRFILLLVVGCLAAALVISQIAVASTIVEQMQQPLTNVDLPTSEGVGAEVIVGNIINVFLSIFGVLFLALMVYGGYKWMMAQGREEELKKAKDIIRSAIIGLGVVFLAFAISLFVIRGFGAATGFESSDNGATSRGPAYQIQSYG
jgi:cytochrome bd-type quinol oxidase subunit 2